MESLFSLCGGLVVLISVCIRVTFLEILLSCLFLVFVLFCPFLFNKILSFKIFFSKEVIINQVINSHLESCRHGLHNCQMQTKLIKSQCHNTLILLHHALFPTRTLLAGNSIENDADNTKRLLHVPTPHKRARFKFCNMHELF